MLKSLKNALNNADNFKTMVILDPHCGIKDDDTLWFVPKPTSFYAFFCDFSGLACYLITTYVDFRHKKISLTRL